MSSDFPALTSSSERALPLYATHLSSGGYSSHAYTPFHAPAASTAAQIAASGLASNGPSQREFTTDDFPALSSASSASDLSGSNRLQQEQAAAALAHRQGLLGSLAGGSPNSFPREADDAKRNHTLKLNAAQNWQLPPGPHGPASRIPSMAPAPIPTTHASSNGLTLPATTQTATNTNGITLQQRIRSPSVPAGTQGAVSPPGNGQTKPLQPHSNGVSADRVAQTPAQQIYFSPADRFGLAGLLNLIKMTDPDVSMLSLGQDLSTMGLDLHRRENLSASLYTPWADETSTPYIEPEYTLPACYNVSPPQAVTKIQHFSEETLFFIFYTAPKDVLQESAAQELYKHNWRYHKELKLWLTKESGVEPIQKTSSYERGTYVFFDPQTWEKVKKEFVLVYDTLAVMSS